jgi:predicted nucleotidyltransferase
MSSVIEQKRSVLEEICRRFHVIRLEVFGSATGPEFDEQSSDLDFLVEFDDVPPGGRFDAYFGLHRALRDLFSRPVDLVEPDGMRNPYFIRRVNESRRLVYAP